MTEVTVEAEFRKLRELARYTRMPQQHVEGRERLIRFLDRYSVSGSTVSIVDSLCAHFGLYPYMSPDRTSYSTPEALAWEFHRPEVGFNDPNFVFHSEQTEVFYRLMDGESVILSAPTSFGKSVILDALVASGKWSTVVAIVPTIALIDEVRRRLVRFGDRYSVITHPTQHAGEKSIYVLTQERFLELPSVPSVDLFMIDEFYKLGSHEADEQRMSMLNIAWNRLRATGAQYYLTGPNVDTLAEALDSSLQESLFVSDYKTVAVDVEDRSDVPDDERVSDMASYWGAMEGSTLVFVASPPRAERIAVQVSEFGAARPASSFAVRVAAWLSENFHPAWRVAIALRAGVGTHTGPMPRSLQRVMIRLFEAGDLGALVCTTTLIEGVNTTAKNVVIYDKKIDRKPIDYFTFSNVRGRAGRMSNHYVGRVITYMPPPIEEAMEVDIPIDSQGASAPLSSIIQLDDDKLSTVSRQRLSEVTNQTDLSLATIKANRGYDPQRQVEAARLLRASRSLRAKFAWTGYPTADEGRAVLEFGLTSLLAPRQRQGMNINILWGRLQAVRNFRDDFASLVSHQERYKFPQQDLSDVVAETLRFQRNWMGFTIPSMLRAAQNIYNDVAASLGERRASYEFYLAEVENLFLPSSLLELDEYGLPLPLALRFSALGMRGDDAAAVIESFISFAQSDQVRSQLSEVELWIVDDVLAGLGRATPQEMESRT